MNSTRLPGKVLKKVVGKTILEHIIERLRKSKALNGTVVATTVNREDLEIVALLSRLGVNLYCGSVCDVLDRYYQTARLHGIEHIVRITGDSPLIDPYVIDDVIKRYFDSGADYCSNILKRTFPDGLDVEAFSFDVLKYAWRNARLLSEREHVTPYIKKNADKFKLVSFENEIDLGDKRWTLDEKEDFEVIKKVFESLYPSNPDFCMKDILKFLESSPHLEHINRHIVCNEGYLKSLREDRIVNIDNLR